MITNRSRGFTLIELLVVIAIIGILSAIVLASLGNARSQGKDAAISEEMSSLRAQAELFYTSNNTYAALFTGNNTWASADANIQSILTAVNVNTAVHTAGSAAGAWAAEAQLTTAGAGYFCVDSTGVAKKTANVLAAGGTVCP